MNVKSSSFYVLFFEINFTKNKKIDLKFIYFLIYIKEDAYQKQTTTTTTHCHRSVQ
jgi:hypothetical protein